MKRRTVFEGLAYIAGGAYAALFFFAAILRLLYPYEVEWMEGSILDHAIRILQGKPIYAPPSLDFVAWMYTPFYYYVTALAMKIGGTGLWAGRAVSIAATLLTVLLVGLIIHRETSRSSNGAWFLPISGAMLYLAFYHITGFYYDTVRMDALALLLVVASVYAALYLQRGYLIAAVFAVLAYFTKQQMIFILPALGIYFLIRKRRQAMLFTLVVLALLFLGTYTLNAATDGWYRFYTYTVPSMKAAGDFSWRDALEFFPITMFGTLGLFMLVILAAILLRQGIWRDHNMIALLAGAVLAMASASLSLGNPGGYKNVLMPLAAMIAILFPLCVERISENVRVSPSFAPALMFLAFLALAYNPVGEKMLFASARQRNAGNEFIAVLRQIPGDVWIPFHGYLGTMAGKPTHPFFMAMNDALVPQDARSLRFRREIDSSLAAHRFSAIILDEEHAFHWDSIPHYTRARAIFQTPNVFLSRLGDAATRPQFIYLPAHDS